FGHAGGQQPLIGGHPLRGVQLQLGLVQRTGAGGEPRVETHPVGGGTGTGVGAGGGHGQPVVAQFVPGGHRQAERVAGGGGQVHSQFDGGGRVRAHVPPQPRDQAVDGGAAARFGQRELDLLTLGGVAAVQDTV